MTTLPPIDEIIANFELLEDSSDRLEYVIELGRLAEPLPPEKKTEENRVRGCASQVWLDTTRGSDRGRPVLHFHGDSDAIITRGIVALIAAIFSGRTAEEIADIDALTVFREIGIGEHLSAQRSNGARSMMERIRRDAQAAVA
ncbi:MAG TPA: SufE family protein [Microvirga sp.]|jgi:cysteine desulfuration protein SufE|nr:SufE family protein [Microvirga sp.]